MRLANRDHAHSARSTLRRPHGDRIKTQDIERTMTILPLVAASLFAPHAPADYSSEPAWREPLHDSPPPLAAQDPEASSDSSSDFYLRASGGFVTTSDSSGPGEEIDFDEGYLLSLGIGRRLGASDGGVGFALELDGLWTDQDVSDSGGLQAVTDLSVAGVLLDGIVDYRISERLSIYAGAGLGVAWLDVGTSSDSLSDFQDEDGPFLAWQGRAGFAWHFSESIALHVGYRFLNIDDAEVDDGVGDSSFELETQQHVLEAGLIFGL